MHMSHNPHYAVQSRNMHVSVLIGVLLNIGLVHYEICTTHLTNWGRVTHICVNKLAIIGSDNGLLPSWCQAIIWTNAGILLIWSLETNYSEILIEI